MNVCKHFYTLLCLDHNREPDVTPSCPNDAGTLCKHTNTHQGCLIVVPYKQIKLKIKLWDHYINAETDFNNLTTGINYYYISAMAISCKSKGLSVLRTVKTHVISTPYCLFVFYDPTTIRVI